MLLKVIFNPAKDESVYNIGRADFKEKGVDFYMMDSEKLTLEIVSIVETEGILDTLEDSIKKMDAISYTISIDYYAKGSEESRPLRFHNSGDETIDGEGVEGSIRNVLLFNDAMEKLMGWGHTKGNFFKIFYSPEIIDLASAYLKMYSAVAI